MRFLAISVAAGIIAMLATTRPVAAQDLRLRARSAAGGVVKAQRWTPILVDIESALPSFRGELVLTFGDAVLRRDIVLPSPGRRQFEHYLRTGNPQAIVHVEVTSSGGRVAAADVPVRALPVDERVVLCVMSADGTVPDAGCSTTVGAELLPRSLLGYGAIDEVAWPPSDTRVSNIQREAFRQWQEFRRLEVSGDLSLSRSPSRPLLKRGLPSQSQMQIALVGGLYLVLLMAAGGVATRRTPGLTTASVLLVGAIVAGTGLAYSVGRVGAGGIRAHHDSVLHQIPGTSAAVVAMRGVLEFPADDRYAVRLRLAEGVIEPPPSDDKTEIGFDADGFSVIDGAYGLGSRRSFSVEGVLNTSPLEVTTTGSSVTVVNRSPHTLQSCRFADAFSRSAVGEMVSGASATAERLQEVAGPIFSCTTTGPAVELTSERAVEMLGTTLIAVYNQAPPTATGGLND